MTTHTSLWALSLLLEILLVAGLFLRRSARRVPLFTALIAFYLVRSTVLFVLSGHVDPPALELTYTTLSSLDLLLQLAVAWELFVGGWRLPPRSGADRPAVRFAVLVAVSAAIAWLLSIWLPASARTPIDRSVLFTSALMLAVFASVRDRFAGTLHRRVLQGFALLGIAGMLAQTGRTFAALHRDAHDFTRWSWVQPGTYLAVLVFWITTTVAGGVSEAGVQELDGTRDLVQLR